VPSAGAVILLKPTSLPLIKYPSGVYFEASVQVKVMETPTALAVKLVT